MWQGTDVEVKRNLRCLVLAFYHVSRGCFFIAFVTVDAKLARLWDSRDSSVSPSISPREHWGCRQSYYISGFPIVFGNSNSDFYTCMASTSKHRDISPAPGLHCLSKCQVTIKSKVPWDRIVPRFNSNISSAPATPKILTSNRNRGM